MVNNENLLKSQRQAQILQVVQKHGQVTVMEISTMFGISEVTARRDLIEMDEMGKVRRTHGGAVSIFQVQSEPSVLERARQQQDEKCRIGQAAVTLVHNGETIFLGSGTTVLQLACALPDLRLTVITNSLTVVNELNSRPNIDLILIGGMLRKFEQSMVGHIAELALQEFRADRVFMGIRSIDADYGFTNDDFPDTLIDRTLFSISSQVVVLADHTKFGRVSLVRVAPLSAAKMIITDTGIPDSMLERVRAIVPNVLTV